MIPTSINCGWEELWAPNKRHPIDTLVATILVHQGWRFRCHYWRHAWWGTPIPGRGKGRCARRCKGDSLMGNHGATVGTVPTAATIRTVARGDRLDGWAGWHHLLGRKKGRARGGEASRVLRDPTPLRRGPLPRLLHVLIRSNQRGKLATRNKSNYNFWGSG